MKKNLGYPLAAFTMCIVALSSCQNDFLEEVNGENRVPLTRQISLAADVQEEQTRAAYDAEGSFIWSATDAISVYDGSNFYKLDLTDGEGTRFANFSGLIGEADPQFALYPYNSGHKLSSKGKLIFNFPSVYENYVCGESNTPMYATITSIDGGASFTHLGATIRIKLSGVPAGVKKVTVSTDVNLSGESALAIEEGVATLATPEGGRSITYTLENATTDNDNLMFDVPVLSGTYNMFSVDARDASGTILKTFNFIKKTKIERAHIKPYNINYATSTSGTAYVDNGIPQLVLQTPDKVGIVSKEEYIEGAMMSLKNADGETEYTGMMKVKGRGNSTWTQPKKPYKMKLDENVSFFNGPKDREWILLANYIDKTMVKTAFTYKIANDYGHFDFVPKFEYVDLILNGKYNGTYQMGDQMKIAKGRALNGVDGYLLETDYRANFESDAVIFKSNKIAYPFNIKNMKVNGIKDVTASEEDPNYVYIRDFVLNAENVLYSDDWLDPDNGYKQYMDMQSYVEWYLINEIGRNNDACFFSSCYMTLKMGEGEKLHMGPLWDFDLAYGGSTNAGNDQPEGFWIKNSGWFVRLFEDPEFVNAVKAQYNIYYAHKEDLLNSIDLYAATIEKSAIANNKLWGTLCNKASDEQTTKQAFYTQIDNLKTWITTRMDWMKLEFDAM